MFKRFLTTLLMCSLIIFNTTNLVRAQESFWTNLYSNYYLSSVETTSWGILIGERDGRIWNKPFNGIYESLDFGKTWKPLGLKDKGITNIKFFDNEIYATTFYHTDTFAGLFKSKDQGNTWEHIGPNYSASYVEVVGENIFLGTYAHGLYVSFDKGITWEQKTPEIEIRSIKIRNEEIFAIGTNKIFKSSDKGNSWKEINFEQQNIEVQYKKYLYTYKNGDLYENTNPTNLHKIITDLTVVFTDKPFLLAVVQDEGIFSYEIPLTQMDKNPMLRIPWEYTEENELIDKITSYFDHEYPFLGNPYIKESTEISNTTMNFLGLKEKQPTLYYSSHNGTDFSLPLDTPLYATADGLAKYFWCYDCGNSIEIDHENGYKSIYMHLSDDLKIDKNKISKVYEGQIIGKVGLTGKTTGPHLHLTIKKDNIVMDPYGWQSSEVIDPWEIFSINNIYGVKSSYLWKNPLHQSINYINGENYSEINLDNKNISFTKNIIKTGLTIYLKNYMKPYKQQGLRYINNTSILIEAIDLVGNITQTLPLKTKISFILPSEILAKELSIRFFNTDKNIWEPLETFKDGSKNILYGYTNHFSQFAVFENTNYLENSFTDKVIIKNSEFNFFKTIL